MNYIDEDTAFERWCETNYLPIYSQAIWKKLFKRFNRSGWCEWVTVDNLTLMAEVQLSNKNTFIGYRDKLADAGLIEYVKGKKGTPNKYKLISIHAKYGTLNVLNTEPETKYSTLGIPNPAPYPAPNPAPYPAPNLGNIKKDLNKTKQKPDKEINPMPAPTPARGGNIFDGRVFSEPLKTKTAEWLAYKREKGSGYKETGLKSLLTQIENKARDHGEERVIALISDCMASNYSGIIWDKLTAQGNIASTKADNLTGIEKLRQKRMGDGG